MFLKRFKLFAALLAAACGPHAGFQSKQDPTVATRASGRALIGGRPVVAEVFALESTGAKLAHATTTIDGEFSLELPRSGALRFAFNDRSGNGRLIETSVQPGGENLLGDIDLVPLDQAANLLILRGIGFEERLTASTGDHRYTKYNSDVTRAYSAVRRPASSKYDLVEIDLATGAETVLLADTTTSSGWDPIPQLVENRILIAQITRPCSATSQCPNGFADYFTLVGYDVQQHRISFELPFGHSGTGWAISANRLVGLVATERTPDGGETLGGQPTFISTFRPRALNLSTLAWEVNSSAEFTFYHFGFTKTGPAAAVFWGLQHCTVAMLPSCSDDVLEPHVLNLSTLAVTRLGSIRSDWSKSGVVLSRDGRALFAAAFPERTTTRDVRVLTRLDLTNGRRHDFGEVNRAATQVQVAVSDDGLQLTSIETVNNTYLARNVNVTTSTISAVNMSASYAGTSVALCTNWSSSICSVSAVGNTLRLVQYNRPGGVNPVWVLDGLHATSPALRKFTLGEMEEPIIATRLGHEVLASRSPTEHLQLLTGPAGVDPASAQRLTWLPSDHDQVAVSLDGSLAFHVARDPLTGHRQVFQVVTGH